MNKFIFIFLSVISIFFNATQANAQKIVVNEADQIYAYMFPLMVAYTSKNVFTNVEVPTGKKAPVNQIGNARTLYDANVKDIVRPNADTLYSNIFVDVSKEPMVLSMPAIKNRYFLIPFLDEYGNSDGSFGTRTGETDATTYVIVSGNYKGKIPSSLKNAKVVKLSGNFSYIMVRVQVFGPDDIKNVTALQDQFKLVPLSAYGNPNYVPPKGVVNPNYPSSEPNEYIFGLSARDYYNQAFKYYNDSNPARFENVRFKRLLNKKGIVHGKTTSFDDLSPDVQKELEESLVRINEVYKSYLRTVNFASLAPIGFFPTNGEITVKNGWLYWPNDLADFGGDYALRALVALGGYGANLNRDAVYPTTSVDSNGQSLVGEKKYTLTIPFIEQKTIVRAFWSITMYQNELFVANPLNRYSLNSASTIKENEDGSVTFYIQSQSPGKDKEANWLPAPKSGNFSVMLRLYWPSKEFLSGKLPVPNIVEVK